jgi:hypothetical protein
MSDLDDEEYDSSGNESSTCSEEETQTERAECDILSATECIACSDQQTESLGSMIPVMRLRGGAPKKRRRRAYFQGSSNQHIDEMRVEIHTDSEGENEDMQTEGQTDDTQPDADTTQELTEEAITLLNEEAYVPVTTPRPPRREHIQIEYASGTDKWHLEDTPGVHMYGGTDITMAEAMSKSAEDLTRGIYNSADTIAPLLVQDWNARGHRMPTRIDQNRAWTQWNNSPRQSEYSFCQVCQHRRPETLIYADACHTVCNYCGQEHDNREVHTGSCVGVCYYCGVSGGHSEEELRECQQVRYSMEDEYQPLYRLRRLLQREVWHRISNDHIWQRDDPSTETVVEALIDVQRAIGDLPHELTMALRRRREIYMLNLREDRAAQAKGATVNRPHPVRARKSNPPPRASNRLDREDVLSGVRPFRGKYHAWNVEFTHLRTDHRFGAETPTTKGSQSPATCSEDLETEEVPTKLTIWEDLRVMRSSRYIHNFLVELLDEAQAHSHDDNVAMAHAIIEIGLSDRSHYEQTQDLQEWVNSYAWAATDQSTSNDDKAPEGDAEASERDDDVNKDS